ncbi:MAG: restriction endonuclease [Candidatus Aminicenantales bacterium]
MSVPDFQSFFKPLLEFASDGKEHSLKEASEIIAKKMSLSEEELKEPLPSGLQTKFYNRLTWAKTYFIQAKVLYSSKKGYFQITQRGIDLIKQGNIKIDIKVLDQYPEFVEFHTPKGHQPPEPPSTNETPEESLERSYQSIRNDLVGQILDKIKANSPKFFEDLVVDLMVAMGYGGSHADAGQSVGQSGDEGIDGIIKEDKLGLDVIYLQAKRWDGSVGRPEIQKFVGALHGKHARKGVFITTGKFSQDALDFIKSIESKVILIDGRTLAELMIDHSLGTTTMSTYHIKRLDMDYFTEE